MKRQRSYECSDNLDLAISLVRPPQQSNITSSFECKTCNRKFSSFQALGGHRASHKKPKLDAHHSQVQLQNANSSLHECSICGQRFSLGQALGGHMRKHRPAAFNHGFPSVNESAAPTVPVLKRCTSKRVMCLDLNLTPLENDLKLLFGNKAPPINLSLC